MTDPGDEKLSRRYRELAREEPPAALDAAILKAARESRAQTSGNSGTRWMGPISIAAVLVLGIGVSLRMQMEQPGVETSAPPPSVSEYSMPAAPDPVEEPPKAKDLAGARQDAAPAPLPKLAAPAAKPEPRAAATPELSGAVKELAKRSEAPATTITAPASVPASAGAPAPAPEAAPPPPVGPSAGRAAAQSAPLRAKREGFAADSAASGSRRIAAVADPDPNRELERIALLREAGRHAEADRALEELRRHHPGFRIPDAVWERVKPR